VWTADVGFGTLLRIAHARSAQPGGLITDEMSTGSGKPLVRGDPGNILCCTCKHSLPLPGPGRH
jgi:hypothetical protein